MIEKPSIEDLLVEGGVPKAYVPIGLIALINALREEKEVKI